MGLGSIKDKIWAMAKPNIYIPESGQPTAGYELHNKKRSNFFSI